MDALIGNLVTALLGGGPAALPALLIIIIIVLIFDRRRLTADIQRKDDKLDKIVEEYYRGNLSLAQALESFKSVLAEIKGKL